MNFRIGQKLVCLIDFEFSHSLRHTDDIRRLPKKDEIVTFDGIKRGVFIYLKEYNQASPIREGFDYRDFRPLIGDEAKSELISSFVEVTETSDCPINVPETENV